MIDWVLKGAGILVIGVSISGLSNSLGMQMLANDSKGKDFIRRCNIATLTAGIFGVTLGIGICLLTF